MRKTVSGLTRERTREVMLMMEEKQPSHVRKRTSLSETYEELCLIPSDEFDKKILIHEHLLFQKNGEEQFLSNWFIWLSTVYRLQAG